MTSLLQSKIAFTVIHDKCYSLVLPIWQILARRSIIMQRNYKTAA